MPLRCVNIQGENVFSFQFDENDWNALKVENKSLHHLHMQCCPTNAVLKTSKLGTRFFAHSKRGECTSAPESAEHLLAKLHIIEAIHGTDWIVRPEQRGKSPCGEVWVADVLAQKDSKKIAFEVQWSQQGTEETVRRQNKYRESGVIGFWFLRKLELPVSRDVPAFRLCFNKNNNCFDVLLPSPRYGLVNKKTKNEPYSWQQVIPLKQFILGVIAGKLKFAPTCGVKLPVDVYSAPILCWNCKRETNLITSIKFNPSMLLVGHPDFTIEIHGLQMPNDLSILSHILPSEELAKNIIGTIKPRSNQEYLSNGCFHCDAIHGRYTVADLYSTDKLSFSAEVVLSESIVRILDKEKNSIFCWWYDGENS